ncbi:hypothetical protein A0O28_0028560 [Trichoderma guizhouense]|uniref:Uncharacterized protein n=1 Tax=Trichoderma guizhouense TaxID=1491466 RepID=A0A1T3CTV8_9HYPO|nr:hypothetical protein A0O28_0028560 [Trichoderma guizhouense]
MSFFEFGLKVSHKFSSPITAQAYRLLGHISLDIAQPRAAVSAYQQALALREKIEARDSPPIADVCDSIACAYTEAGNVEHAFKYLEKATAIHNANDPSIMSRTLAIRATTCLRAGQAKYALDAIRECWRMQNMTRPDRTVKVSQAQWGHHAPFADILAPGQKGRGSGARITRPHDAERHLRRERP